MVYHALLYSFRASDSDILFSNAPSQASTHARCIVTTANTWEQCLRANAVEVSTIQTASPRI